MLLILWEFHTVVNSSSTRGSEPSLHAKMWSVQTLWRFCEHLDAVVRSCSEDTALHMSSLTSTPTIFLTASSSMILCLEERRIDTEVPFVAEHSTGTYSLLFVQYWVSVFTPFQRTVHFKFNSLNLIMNIYLKEQCQEDPQTEALTVHSRSPRCFTWTIYCSGIMVLYTVKFCYSY